MLQQLLLLLSHFSHVRLQQSPHAMLENLVQSPGWEDPHEKEMATHSSILAWEIPWAEELGWLQFIGSQKSDMTEVT